MAPTASSITEMSALYARRMPLIASSVIVSVSDNQRNDFSSAL